MVARVIVLIGASVDETLPAEIEKYVSTKYRLKTEPLPFAQFDTPAVGALYLLCLGDNDILELFSREDVSSMDVGIVFNDRCRNAARNYGIAPDTSESIDDVLNGSEATPVDLLTCNAKPVFGNIVIGDVRGMNQVRGQGGFMEKAAALFSSLTRPAFQSYTFTTAKGSVTATAATGVLVFEHNMSGLSRNILNENLSLHDGRLHALILAPSSVAAYLYYLFLNYFLNRLFLEHLPRSIGLIGSSALVITGSRPIVYTANGELSSDETLALNIKRDAVRIHLGRNIEDIPAANTPEEEKETIRVQGLPRGDMTGMLVSESIPFFPKADEEDFKELFVGLRQNAGASSVFITLMILSTLLATTGLFQNSAPVIIGAMILAPLMSPIISFSMGVVRGEKELLRTSSSTLLIGIATALAFSCIYTYLTPLNMVTDEMRGRLNPNILDLMVAIISGIAGAYAHAKSEVAKSLAGVAIAVALVPPLSVTGIGIGWWDGEIVYGSFLLFLTNLAGITLAAAVTFLVLGFAPIKRATKGIVISSLFLTLVTVPLFVSFNKVIQQHTIFSNLKKIESFESRGRTVTIQALSVDLSGKKPLIHIKTRSDTTLGKEELQRLKRHIHEAVNRPVVINILSEIELQ